METSTRLIDMTLDELLAVLDARDAEKRRAEAEQASVPSLVYGLAGIRQLYGCSKSTAHRILHSGCIDEAVTQIGRKIVINSAKALRCLPKEGNR